MALHNKLLSFPRWEWIREANAVGRRRMNSGYQHGIVSCIMAGSSQCQYGCTCFTTLCGQLGYTVAEPVCMLLSSQWRMYAHVCRPLPITCHHYMRWLRRSCQRWWRSPRRDVVPIYSAILYSPATNIHAFIAHLTLLQWHIVTCEMNPELCSLSTPHAFMIQPHM